MLLPFQIGVGGKLGGGDQWMSWISIDDLCYVISTALHTPALSGAINCIAPQCVPNSEFTKTLGKILHRPTICSVPSFALKTLLGEMADELLLSSTRCEPKKLLDQSFSFCHSDLESALRHTLGK